MVCGFFTLVTEMLVNILNICIDEELEGEEDEEQSEAIKRKKLYAAKYRPLAKWPGCLQFLGQEELVLKECTWQLKDK